MPNRERENQMRDDEDMRDDDRSSQQDEQGRSAPGAKGREPTRSDSRGGGEGGSRRTGGSIPSRKKR